MRKFVCRTPTCPRQIITLRFPDLVQSYARITNRLRQALLRRLRAVACPPPTSVRILGVDDWAWKKGQIYGTLLVNLELGKPIALLPDHKEATLEAWLCGHPEIEVVSRDRGGEYAAAVRKGAPQAQQVADTFHLRLHLREKLKELMARQQKLLPHVDTTTFKAIPDKARGALSARAPFPPASEVVERSKPFRHRSPHLRMASAGSAPTPPEEVPSQISRSNRYARGSRCPNAPSTGDLRAGDCPPLEAVPPDSPAVSES